MRWSFWKHGIIQIKCVKCKLLIGTSEFGEIPKITKTKWDLCERCQQKERGFIGAKDPKDLAIG